ncbi:CU044_5270 family protein [Streptomyces sp. NPDC004435]|uniref:CU044_5270 family protein n=1 Tax=Streptomyces sp. NPDC004435 TaxID=3364701 RepID=UPI003685F614
MRGAKGKVDGGRMDDGLDEARRGVPAFPVPGPAEQRERERRRHLLGEIDRMAGRGTGPLVGRRRHLAVLGSAVAVGVLTLTLGFPSTPPPGAPAAPADPTTVALLERAALAAASEPEAPVRADQYVYLKVVGHTAYLTENAAGGMDRGRQREDAERWTSVDGTRPGLARQGGREEPIRATSGGKAGFHSPTYAFAASLPSDPDELLGLLREDALRNHGPGSDSTTGPDQQAFVAIGDLLRGTVVPPATTAALYRAAARIPGVVTLPDAVDAAGRTGVAVARVHGGERVEWIFDGTTGRFLGERLVLTRAGAWGEAGDVVTSVAVVGRGVVDEPGQLPSAR